MEISLENFEVLMLPRSWPLSLCKLQIIIKQSCFPRIFGISDFWSEFNRGAGIEKCQAWTHRTS